MTDDDRARAERDWWHEREKAYQRRPEIQAEITRQLAEKDQEDAAQRDAAERLEKAFAAGKPGASDAISEYYNHDALRTSPPRPSAKGDEKEWQAFYQHFDGRDLPLHAQHNAEKYRIDADAPPDVGGMAAEYYERWQPSVHPDDLAAEAAGMTYDELMAERRRDEPYPPDLDAQ
jgi:hypothetical protein